MLDLLRTRILAVLGSSRHELSVSVLSRRLNVPRRELDRALSKLGTQVYWWRIGRGGDRFYGRRESNEG